MCIRDRIGGDLPLERAGFHIRLPYLRRFFTGFFLLRIFRRVEQAARSRRTGGLFSSVFRGFRRGAYRLPFPLFRGFLLPGALSAQFRPPDVYKRQDP